MPQNPQEHKRGFKDGVRYTIDWLHKRALTMNDPRARTILNTAAFHLGVHLNWKAPLPTQESGSNRGADAPKM